MKNILFTLALAVAAVMSSAQSEFTLDQIKSYPFPNELAVSAGSSRIAWAVTHDGDRNLYVAEAPSFSIRKLTDYTGDKGQEFSSVQISPDGNYVLYVRGGDFGSNWDDEMPINPQFEPEPIKVQLWSIPFQGGSPKSLGDALNGTISPDSKKVLFSRGGQLYEIPIDASAEAKKLFHARGRQGSFSYSPDGSKILFESNRGDHSFIGIYEPGKNIQWIAPSFYRDRNPKWSPDGTSVAFIRSEGAGGEPEPVLKDSPQPWSIMRYDLKSESLSTLYTSPQTRRGNMPSTHGGVNLNYAKGFVTYLSYEDGWPHLYAVSEKGGSSRLLTPGNFMAEYISMSPDKKYLYFSGNTGPDKLDIDRRHIVQVDIEKGSMKVLTPGNGNEWTPFALADGKNVAFISAGSRRPPLVAVMDLTSTKQQLLGENLIPDNFPSAKMVEPEQVVFKAPDGTPVHATFFATKMKKNEKRPAVVYIHGGPPRQMLLGWHYSSYYSNAYAMNQYLASLGFVVIAVNYRLGIGYGHDFHRPEDGGTRGASEYQDIKAAGEWLASHPNVDASRIGVYGGSYGGYLTAMALARNSDIFACGVDIHGVHERTDGRVDRLVRPDRWEKVPDGELAAEIAWKSSPVAYMDTWKSPVLVIHADDDRNVQFSQSTDLVQRLKAHGVEHETLVIVDDTHHFMMHANQMKVNLAIAAYLSKKLKP